MGDSDGADFTDKFTVFYGSPSLGTVLDIGQDLYGVSPNDAKKVAASFIKKHSGMAISSAQERQLTPKWMGGDSEDARVMTKTFQDDSDGAVLQGFVEIVSEESVDLLGEMGIDSTEESYGADKIGRIEHLAFTPKLYWLIRLVIIVSRSLKSVVDEAAVEEYQPIISQLLTEFKNAYRSPDFRESMADAFRSPEVREVFAEVLEETLKKLKK